MAVGQKKDIGIQEEGVRVLQEGEQDEDAPGSAVLPSQEPDDKKRSLRGQRVDRKGEA